MTAKPITKAVCAAGVLAGALAGAVAAVTAVRNACSNLTPASGGRDALTPGPNPPPGCQPGTCAQPPDPTA
ncbi:hypothetical protein ACFZDG_16575 [Kitasatospora xanthocidica]|uniref:hypothetical protein n=1 Tax=Kitasatospora xanthocidica TaxID=83382 RepID=UPI0036E6CC70